MFVKNSRALKRIGPHNKDVISVLIGSLLGDGHAEKRGNSTRIHINMSAIHKEYLLWLHNFFSERGYCSPIIPKIRPYTDKKGAVYFSYRFVTYSFSSLNWLHEIFYVQKQKRIPLTIFSLLDQQALAIWFMDDGYRSREGAVLSTECFTDLDIDFLLDVFKQKFGLFVTRQKRKTSWRLYISKNQMALFAHLVKPYMVKCMFYKLGKHG